MNDDGFMEILFDLSFSKFLTSRIVPGLYVTDIIFSGLCALAVPVGLYIFFDHPAGFFVGLLAGVPVFFFLVIMARLWREFIIVLFKIAENTKMTATRLCPPLQVGSIASIPFTGEPAQPGMAGSSVETVVVEAEREDRASVPTAKGGTSDAVAATPPRNEPLLQKPVASSDQIAMETDYAARVRSLLKLAVHQSHFDLLDGLVSQLSQELSAKYGENGHSEVWVKLALDLGRKRQECIQTASKAKNESACLGCRGRLSPYEMSEQICSRCKARAVQFEQHIVRTN